MLTVWKNFDGCTILIILSSYHEIERHKGYMDFRELIGLNREWHIRSGQEKDKILEDVVGYDGGIKSYDIREVINLGKLVYRDCYGVIFNYLGIYGKILD